MENIIDPWSIKCFPPSALSALFSMQGFPNNVILLLNNAIYPNKTHKNCKIYALSHNPEGNTWPISLLLKLD